MPSMTEMISAILSELLAIDHAHLVDHVVHYARAARGGFERLTGERIRFARMLGILAHRGRQFFHT